MRIDEIEEEDVALAERPGSATRLRLAEDPELLLGPDRRLTYLAALAASGIQRVDLVPLGGVLRQRAAREQRVVIRVGRHGEHARGSGVRRRGLEGIPAGFHA